MHARFIRHINREHGTTVLLTTHDLSDEEKLCDRANTLGARLKQRLQSIRDDVPEIVDIRGLGFMNAVEFNNVPHTASRLAR